jgi:hypothetical protein
MIDEEVGSVSLGDGFATKTEIVKCETGSVKIY